MATDVPPLPKGGNTTPSLRRIPGANDRIHVGVIGCGLRGRGDLMTGLHRWDRELNAEIIAVCDVWRQRREEAAAMARDWYGREPRQCVSYLEVLDMPEVDAVIIASPDHVHTLHLEAAARAGKHAYCEKPLAKDMEGLCRAVDAVRESGVVVQVGTHWRSLPALAGAREVIRSGALGTIARVEQYFNDPRPYWYPRLKEAREEDVDWAAFLNDRSPRPFDPWMFTGWMGHREFSDGAVPGYGSHFVDLVRYFTGVGAPASCVCLGGQYVWRDAYRFTCPDTVQAVWEYPEGFQVTYSTCFCNDCGDTFRVFGSNAMMNLDDWFRFGAAPDFHVTSAGAGRPDGRVRDRVPVEPVDRPDHMRNWLECLRDGTTPIASIDDGYYHSVAVIMAMEAYDRGCRVKYDHERRRLYAD
ncbi:MAG TPA: Gfo/Idh/MocA family oxidoreductase [Candidatus Hydrogenedentes bacterium]|nr:Gfo/Idh/MocA family oxidoreductase [Candidatus Hydrogenedentota bacterium]